MQSKNGLLPQAQDLVREVAKLGYQKDIDTYDNPDAIELWQGNLTALFAASLGTSPSAQIIYQREIEVKEDLYADIAILYQKEYGLLRLVVERKEETTFLVDVKPECSRFISGFLAVNDKVKVYYSISAACGKT